MARLARVVIPGLPHHVTQRGNGRARTFFSDDDYTLYLKLLTSACAVAKVRCLGYVLMPNHVHLILVPKDADGLRKAMSSVHRAYAGQINARRKKTGHFWQGRYGAAVMDENHLTEAFRYILRNPVVAKLVSEAERWPWSSARAYLKGGEDGLTTKGPMLSRFPSMRTLLGDKIASQDFVVRDDETIGRPRGSAAFIAGLERKTGRTLQAEKRGPKPKKSKVKPVRRKSRKTE